MSTILFGAGVLGSIFLSVGIVIYGWQLPQYLGPVFAMNADNHAVLLVFGLIALAFGVCAWLITLCMRMKSRDAEKGCTVPVTATIVSQVSEDVYGEHGKAYTSYSPVFSYVNPQGQTIRVTGHESSVKPDTYVAGTKVELLINPEDTRRYKRSPRSGGKEVPTGIPKFPAALTGVGLVMYLLAIL